MYQFTVNKVPHSTKKAKEERVYHIFSEKVIQISLRAKILPRIHGRDYLLPLRKATVKKEEGQLEESIKELNKTPIVMNSNNMERNKLMISMTHHIISLGRPFRNDINKTSALSSHRWRLLCHKLIENSIDSVERMSQHTNGANLSDIAFRHRCKNQ